MEGDPATAGPSRIPGRRLTASTSVLFLLIFSSSVQVSFARGDVDDADVGKGPAGGRRKGGTPAGGASRTGSSVGDRAKLNAALDSMLSRGGRGGKDDANEVFDGGLHQIPPGTLGFVGGTGKRERAFEGWVREQVPKHKGPGDDGDAASFGPGGVIGPVEIRSVHGRGRGVVTTRNVSRGETLLEIPLMKCLSTASARSSAIGHTFATIKDPQVSIDAVIALHLLHELYVQKEKSPWWPWLRILPRDIESPLQWLPKELAHLEGSNLVGFRDAVLEGWNKQREALVPNLTKQFPELFPEHHFRASRWVWAMACVWSRAADISVGGGKTHSGRALRVMVPFLDMVNHGYEHGGDEISALKPTWDASRGMVVIKSGVPLPGPGKEVRFNYGDKPSQYILLQYGFVPINNPSECVEVALHLKKTDKLRGEKLALLAKHDLSPAERNFHFFPRRLDGELLAATRIQMMTKDELDDPAAAVAAVAGAPVSDRNEAKVRAALLKAAYDMLARYPTTLWEDKKTVMDALEAPWEVDEDDGGDSGEASARPLPSKHVRLAISMRIQEKTTLLAAARLLLKELSAEMGEEVCEERYPGKELEACLDRVTGVAFDAFDQPPPSNHPDDKSNEAEERSKKKRRRDSEEL